MHQVLRFLTNSQLISGVIELYRMYAAKSTNVPFSQREKKSAILKLTLTEFSNRFI